MNEHANRNGTTEIDELSDRIEYHRKIAKRLAVDTPEYAADDPSRDTHRSTGYRVLGPEVTGSGRERGVRPNASENSQISPLSTVRASQGDGR